LADADAPTTEPVAAAAGITAVLADFLALLGAFLVFDALVDVFLVDLALDFCLVELDLALLFLGLDLVVDFFWALVEVFDSWAKISETGIANAKQTSIASSRWRVRERIQENMTKAQKNKIQYKLYSY